MPKALIALNSLKLCIYFFFFAVFFTTFLVAAFFFLAIFSTSMKQKKLLLIIRLNLFYALTFPGPDTELIIMFFVKDLSAIRLPVVYIDFLQQDRFHKPHRKKQVPSLQQKATKKTLVQRVFPSEWQFEPNPGRVEY